MRVYGLSHVISAPASGIRRALSPGGVITDIRESQHNLNWPKDLASSLAPKYLGADGAEQPLDAVMGAALHTALENYLALKGEQLLNVAKVVIHEAMTPYTADFEARILETVRSTVRAEIREVITNQFVQAIVQAARTATESIAPVPATPPRVTQAIDPDYGQVERRKIEQFAKYHSEWGDHATYTFSYVYPEGLACEFGVYMGGSIRFFANQRPNLIFHGFDSFEGLNESWGGFDVGHLDLGGRLPADLPRNVCIHPGWFEQSLPVFTRLQPGTLVFGHIDCDLYSSTVTVLREFEDRIRPGTVLMFDEYFTGHEKGDECKAFLEFIARTGLRYRYLSAHYTTAVGSVALIVE